MLKGADDATITPLAFCTFHAMIAIPNVKRRKQSVPSFRLRIPARYFPGVLLSILLLFLFWLDVPRMFLESKLPSLALRSHPTSREELLSAYGIVQATSSQLITIALSMLAAASYLFISFTPKTSLDAKLALGVCFIFIPCIVVSIYFAFFLAAVMTEAVYYSIADISSVLDIFSKQAEFLLYSSLCLFSFLPIYIGPRSISNEILAHNANLTHR